MTRVEIEGRRLGNPAVPVDIPERYTVLVCALPDPDGAPAIVRFRRWLKSGLRAFGLRCVRCEPLDAPAGPPDAAEPSA